MIEAEKAMETFSAHMQDKSILLTNYEKYAAYTVPSVFPEENVDSTTELSGSFTR